MLNPHEMFGQQGRQLFEQLMAPMPCPFPSPVSSQGSMQSFTDFHGNSISVGTVNVRFNVIVTSIAGNIKDSNDFYIVAKKDQWFGTGGSNEILAYMRLNTLEPLKEGDIVLAEIYGVTSGSPDPNDDAFPLMSLLNFNGTSGVWVKYTGTPDHLGLLATPLADGTFNDSMTIVEAVIPSANPPTYGDLSTGNYYFAVAVGGNGASGYPAYELVFFLNGSGGSITVQDKTGTPSFSGISVLQTDGDQGFVVTNPAGGTALISIQDASLTQVGVVNLTDQNMGDGKKIFNQSVVVNDSLTSGKNLTVHDSAFINFLDDSSEFHANTLKVTPIAGTSLDHDIATMNGIAKIYNTDTSKVYSESGFVADVYAVEKKDHTGLAAGVLTEVNGVPGFVTPTGDATEVASHISFNTGTDYSPYISIDTLIGDPVGAYGVFVASNNGTNPATIGMYTNNGPSYQGLPQGGAFVVGGGGCVLTDAAGVPNIDSGIGNTPPTAFMPAYGISGPTIVGNGLYWGLTSVADPVGGEGLTRFRGGLCTDYVCNRGDIEYATDDFVLARLGIGVVGQVLNVIDVGMGVLLPRWSEVPYVPTNAGDWAGNPANMAVAMDRVAAAIASGAIGVPIA